jgi:hypothetical protein
MKVMMDNFAFLDIEYYLLNGFSDIVSPDTVIRLNEKLIKKIVAETENSQIERARTLKKLEIFETDLQTLSRFGRNKIIGRWSWFMKTRSRKSIN